MKYFKTIIFFLLLAGVFPRCSSAQQVQTQSPFPHHEVYFQKWIAGIKGGGSGINLFIPFSNELPKNIQLDSVYFRGAVAKLEKIDGDKILYVGRFNTEFNQKQDVIMSRESDEEYGNEAPIVQKKNLFELTNSECVVSYKDGNNSKYFKIENISEKVSLNYPISPPNKQ